VIAILPATAVPGEQLEFKHIPGMGMISIGLLAIDGRAGIILRTTILNQKA